MHSFAFHIDSIFNTQICIPLLIILVSHCFDYTCGIGVGLTVIPVSQLNVALKQICNSQNKYGCLQI